MSRVSTDEAVSIEVERAAGKVQEPASGAFPY
jgi:hypothetical protein